MLEDILKVCVIAVEKLKLKMAGTSKLDAETELTLKQVCNFCFTTKRQNFITVNMKFEQNNAIYYYSLCCNPFNVVAFQTLTVPCY